MLRRSTGKLSVAILVTIHSALALFGNALHVHHGLGLSTSREGDGPAIVLPFGTASHDGCLACAFAEEAQSTPDAPTGSAPVAVSSATSDENRPALTSSPAIRYSPRAPPTA